jgi:hypothetical protein
MSLGAVRFLACASHRIANSSSLTDAPGKGVCHSCRPRYPRTLLDVVGGWGAPTVSSLLLGRQARARSTGT